MKYPEGKMKYPIDIKEKRIINGLAQTIHIIGTKESNPVVLFIHGGPGVVDRHSVIAHLGKFTTDITIVTWDQRGTGGSYKGVKKEDMTSRQIVKDAKEMVSYLCGRFKKDKIYIQGHSWGSCVGTLLASKYPERIKAYFGQGQLVNGVKNEELCYDFTMEKAKEAKNSKDIAILEKIGRPVKGLYKDDFYKGLIAQRNLMMKYGGGIKGGSSMWKSQVKPILFSGEYTLKEIAGIIKGYSFTLKCMWPDVVKIDFTKNCRKFDIPMFYFLGTQDYNTPIALSKEYVEKVEAPVKELVWFLESAHSPIAEEPEKFGRCLVEKIKQIEG
jgi:pimeloyl-ACP methyl ester carboxylesterase